MKNMNNIGNKYEITMYEWYEKLLKAEKRLQESIKCNRIFGDNEEWIKEDTEKVNDIKKDIEEIKILMNKVNAKIDYEKIISLAKESVNKNI